MEHSWEITVNSNLVKHAEVDGTTILNVYPEGECVENTLPYIVKDSDQYASLINFTLITSCFYDKLQYWKDLPEQGRIVLFFDKNMDFEQLIPKLNGLLTDDLMQTVETNPFIVLSDILTDPYAELLLREHTPGLTKAWRYSGMKTYRGDMDFEFMQDEIDQYAFKPATTGVLVMDYSSCIEEEHATDSDVHIDDLVLIAKDKESSEVQSMVTSDTIAMLAEDSAESRLHFEAHKQYVKNHVKIIDERGDRTANNHKAVNHKAKNEQKAKQKIKSRAKAKAARKARKRK